MFFSTSVALASLVGLASAANQQILVGSGGKTFTPSNITAAIGDEITFIFTGGNHTVTQSAFATPCELLVNATAGTTGFSSGFVPVPAGSANFPAWTVQINVATPIWFFCEQTGHCQSGMVGSINAATTGNKTFADFKALAMSSTSTPGSSSVISSGVGADASGAISSVAAGAATAAGTATAATTTGTTTSTTSDASTTVRTSGAALVLAAVLAFFVL